MISRSVTAHGRPGIGHGRAHALVQAFTGRHVLVVGDVMLDQFLFGRVQRLSPEAPVPIVEYDHDEFRPGGAANVAVNLAALGASVTLVSVVGVDDTADQLRLLLASGGVTHARLVPDPDRRTTRKLRIVTQRQQQVARDDPAGPRPRAAGGGDEVLLAQGERHRPCDAG